MNRAFYIGATGLQAQQQGLDVIANNITNINTTGFKRSAIRFAELLAPGSRNDEAQASAVALPETLSGVHAQSSARVLEQGKLVETGKQLDLAISGDGYIEVLGPGGQVWLWRGGTLRVNAEGNLETDDGLLLKALIDVPNDSTSLSIDRDGIVRSVRSDGSDPVELGRISLAMPRDSQALESVGSGYYAVGEGDDIETLIAGEDGGVFVQGSLEASNVELTTEMVQLMMMQRAYGANAQVVQAGDQLMAIANGLRR